MTTMCFSCFLMALASMLLVRFIYRTILTRQCGARQAGLELQREVMRWVVLLQQHRGMASGLLQGDLSFRARLYEKQAELTAQLQRIQQLPADVAALMPGEQWQAAITSWQQLQQSVEQMTPAASFTGHTDLIAAQLLLLGEIGDRAGLTLDQRDEHFALLRLVTRVLPQLMETTGQSRALSTAVAVKGSLDSVPQIRLSFLLHKIERLTEEAAGSLARLPGGISAEAHAIHHSRDDALQALTEFRRRIQDDVLGPRGVQVKADEVFRQATATIDACYRLYETVLPPLQREVGKAAAPAVTPAAPQPLRMRTA